MIKRRYGREVCRTDTLKYIIGIYVNLRVEKLLDPDLGFIYFSELVPIGI